MLGGSFLAGNPVMPWVIIGYSKCPQLCQASLVHMPFRFGLQVLPLVWLMSCASLAVAAGPLDGYADYVAFTSEVQALDASELVQVQSLTKTLDGREIFLLTLGSGDIEHKPALLIMGNVHAPQVLASELAIRMARMLVDRAATDDAARALLDHWTIHVIPRPNPDATEHHFHAPYQERETNQRPQDDDHDGQTDEDPADDLNGDGWITMLRVADPTGGYLPHPQDPRIMVLADPAKNERATYRLLTEGRDNDADGQFQEDPDGGVSFNRNFTFRYPYFQPGAGPHQVSEPETRAIADFCFAHPNLAAVLTFTPEDNLFHPWKPDGGAEGQRIKTTLRAADSPAVEFLAEAYRKLHGGSDAPAPAASAGSFSQWAYFHFGRWSFGARAWWVPKVPPPEPKPGETPLPEDPRGADERNMLRWLEREQIDGFVPWTAIDHPDFPGQKVEVGGLKPLYALNPPSKELDPLARIHVDFLLRLVELMPKLSIAETKVEPLGEGVFRLTVEIANDGYLSTMSEMGKTNAEPYPLQFKLELPEGASLISGHLRGRARELNGVTGRHKLEWLLLLAAGQPTQAKITVGSPAVGTTEATLDIK